MKEFHEVVLDVDFRNLFTIYQQVVQSKEQTIDKIVNDFGNMGLIKPEAIGLKKHLSADMATLAPTTSISVKPMDVDSSNTATSSQRLDSPVSP